MSTTQSNPGWALDRLDQVAPPLNSAYVYGANGAGHTIYILDSGISNHSLVAAQFGSRATVFWDVNYEGRPIDGMWGVDCHSDSYGTAVASAAAGNTHGVAKGATLVIVKITVGCTGDIARSTVILAYDWLSNYAPRGTIVNKSSGPTFGTFCGFGEVQPDVEAVTIAAFNRGIIMINAAGNDNCDTATFTPTRMPEVFVVGASDSTRFNSADGWKDTRATFSRYGSNIAAFAPGVNVPVLDYLGYTVSRNGTSFAAPYIAGLAAVACQYYGNWCSNISNSGDAYTALKSFGVMGSVVDPGGVALPGSTPSRFIWRQVW